MTRIKLCGLSRSCDIEAANLLQPEYIGFVFAPKSKRYITPDKALALKNMLHPDIQAVGVFVNEDLSKVAGLLNRGMIDIAQLHGCESLEYIQRLRTLTNKPIIQAFEITSEADLQRATNSQADYILLDSGKGGTGTAFDWALLQAIDRPYFLAGGLNLQNVQTALDAFHPFALDVSSGIETDGVKDKTKMAAFVAAVRKGE